MLPEISEDAMEEMEEEYEIAEEPSKTYKLHPDRGIIMGYVDGKEAILQAVYKILSTERYENIIYTWDYGVELQDLPGEALEYVIPEVERRIEEALLQDERIESVGDFEHEIDKGILKTTFTVSTIYGEVEAENEVSI